MKRKDMRLRDMSIEGKLFGMLFLSLIIIIIGISSNFQAVIMNEGKMPVKAYGVDEGVHSFYQDNSEVNYHLLTDIIRIPLGEKYRAMVSIGDVLMILGFTIYGVTLFKYRYRKK